MMYRKIRILEAVDQPRTALWDELEGYAEVTTVRDGNQAYHLLCEQKFELILVNLMLPGLDGLELLRRIRNQKLCQIVVLTSEFPDFQYAQQGILYGAFDYLIRPLTKEMLVDLIFRARERLDQLDATCQHESMILAQAMGSHDIGLYFDEMVLRLSQEQEDDIRLDVTVRRLYQSVIEQTFASMPWLGQFEYIEAYDAIDWIHGSNRTMVRDFCRRKLCMLSNMIADLYPKTDNDKLNKILLYILEHVDEGCLQKDIAAAHYISNAALSELFRNQLGRSYRSYVTDIKMLRAQYLLQHSNMKIYEISALLGYKDVNYFSRIFRERYGIPLSQFRRRSQPDYQI